MIASIALCVYRYVIGGFLVINPAFFSYVFLIPDKMKLNNRIMYFGAVMGGKRLFS